MADNRNFESRHRTDPDLKDDDPLAELARIVGFEDGQQKLNDDLAADPDAGFDMEAELLRELNIDVEDIGVANEPDPTPQQVIATHAATPASHAEPTAQPLEPELPTEPLDIQPSEDWPLAETTSSSDIASLEAELQAAFSALESGGRRVEPAPTHAPEPAPTYAPEPAPTYAPEPASTYEPEPAPTYAAEPVQSYVPETAPQSTEPYYAEQTVSESELPVLDVIGQNVVPDTVAPILESNQLASAFDRVQNDIDAAIPDEPLLDDGDITAALLAEMADVEAEAVDKLPPLTEFPFDPAEIADSDTTPEAMAEIDVPQYQPESKAQVSATDGFGLMLEDELETLSEPQYASEDAYQDSYSKPPNGNELDYSDNTNSLSEIEFGLETQESNAFDDEPSVVALEEEQSEYVNESEFYTDVTDDYGHEQDSFPEEDDFAADDLVPPTFDQLAADDGGGSGRRGLMAAAVVLGIAVVGGGGFYLWNASLGSDGSADGPRVIAADSDPVKVKPDNPGGKTVPNQDLAVYDKVAGTQSSANQEQNLVTTTEEPVDVVQRTLDPDTLPLEGRSNGVDAAAKSEERLGSGNSLDPAPSASDAQANSIAPRRVRTLIVKPDGTLVAREDPVPTTTNQLSAANNTSTLTTTTGTSTDNGTAAGSDTNASNIVLAPTDSDASTADTNTAVQPTAPEQAAALPPIEDNLNESGTVPLPGQKPVAEVASDTGRDTQVAAVNSGGTDLRSSINAPVPSTRPANQPVNIVEAVTDRGNLAGSKPSGNPGGYVMQIASQPSEAGARQSYQDLSQKYASIIGSRGVDYQRADIPDRGIFYRVRIPAGSKAESNSLCTRYKAAGGSCFVAK